MLKHLRHELELAREAVRALQKTLEEIDVSIGQKQAKADIQQELTEQFARRAGQGPTSETARLAREQFERTQDTLRKLKQLQKRQGYFRDLLAIYESKEARAREALEAARRGLASKKGGIDDKPF